MRLESTVCPHWACGSWRYAWLLLPAGSQTQSRGEGRILSPPSHGCVESVQCSGLALRLAEHGGSLWSPVLVGRAVGLSGAAAWILGTQQQLSYRDSPDGSRSVVPHMGLSGFLGCSWLLPPPLGLEKPKPVTVLVLSVSVLTKSSCSVPPSTVTYH